MLLFFFCVFVSFDSCCSKYLTKNFLIPNLAPDDKRTIVIEITGPIRILLSPWKLNNAYKHTKSFSIVNHFQSHNNRILLSLVIVYTYILYWQQRIALSFSMFIINASAPHCSCSYLSARRLSTRFCRTNIFSFYVYKFYEQARCRDE